MTADCANGRSGFFERRERDVVRIRVRLLVARDGAYADTAIDIERSGLHDAFFEVPAFEAGVLEIEVREVDVARVNRGEDLRQLLVIKIRGGEKETVGVGEQRGGNGRQR